MNKATRLFSSLPALAAVAAVSALAGPARAGDMCSGVRIKEVRITPKAPACVPAQRAVDKIFYARLGFGALPGARDSAGPELGIGLRLELDHVGLDASMNLGASRMLPGMGFDSLRGSLVKLTGQYFLNPGADRSPYLGAGLSWGGERAMVANRTLSGNGLQGEVVAGYEMFRTSAMRLFVQADATLPLYRARSEAQESPTVFPRGGLTAVTRTERYLPMLGLSIGIGWGRARAR